MMEHITYERAMILATAASYVGGIVANRKLKPWIERHRGGALAMGVISIAWWVIPVNAVASYSVRSVCDEAAMAMNVVPRSCAGKSSDSVVKTLKVFSFEPKSLLKLLPGGLPQLTDADFDAEESHRGVLQKDELDKIQRQVLIDSPSYYTLTDDAERARIWNRVVKEMGKGDKYLRDDSEIVTEDARDVPNGEE